MRMVLNNVYLFNKIDLNFKLLYHIKIHLENQKDRFDEIKR